MSDSVMSVNTEPETSTTSSLHDAASSSTVPPPAATESRSELIEQLFAKVEAESERRAREEAEAEAQALSSRQEQEEAHDSVPDPMATITPATNAATVAAIKSRRRGSVSVSRFGQPTELSPEPIVTTSTTPSTRPSRSSSLVIQKAAFYSVGSQNHGSADSLASESANDPDKLVEDVSQSTQIATIAGKQSISKAISRRLSRARTRSRELLGGGGVGTSASANLSLTGGNGNGVVMIDVAVTEATVEYHHSDDEDLDGRPKSSAAVYSGDGPMEKLRTQRSAPGLQQQQSGEKAGWMSKARDLTARIKRRSMAALA